MNLKNTFSHLSKNFFIGLLLVVIGIAIIPAKTICTIFPGMDAAGATQLP